MTRRDEWLRDLAAAEKDLKEAKTIATVRSIQKRIRWIKHYIALNEKELKGK